MGEWDTCCKWMKQMPWENEIDATSEWNKFAKNEIDTVEEWNGIWNQEWDIHHEWNEFHLQ